MHLLPSMSVFWYNVNIIIFFLLLFLLCLQLHITTWQNMNMIKFYSYLWIWLCFFEKCSAHMYEVITVKNCKLLSDVADFYKWKIRFSLNFLLVMYDSKILWKDPSVTRLLNFQALVFKEVFMNSDRYTHALKGIRIDIRMH